MTPAQKECIDRWSLEDLLAIWRFARPGHPYLAGECGKYFSEVMQAKRTADPDGWIRASKQVGWENSQREEFMALDIDG